jgi:ABC-type lipoprotein release transport system permease subunit
MNARDVRLRLRPLIAPRRIDGCVRDVLYAFRTFRRAPLAALTIVTTVALGLGLVLSQSIRPVGLGLLAGSGMAGGLAIALMSTPAASRIGLIVHVFDPTAYAASLASILTACIVAALIPALRAARIDPMKSLRHE